MIRLYVIKLDKLLADIRVKDEVIVNIRKADNLDVIDNINLVLVISFNMDIIIAKSKIIIIDGIDIHVYYIYL
ncbi:hypothetical protein N7501_011575 [Penicillium viridicatum]|nr:hypothetical protein N7501_011575 [Penicillium viridicatum]